MRIGVLGCTGRVGGLIVNELQSGAWDGLELSGGTARNPSKVEGDFFVTSNTKELFEKSDVLIDFTCPTTTIEYAALAAEMQKPLIIGTTGLTAQDEAKLKAAAEKTAIVYAANMSLGVNLLLALVERAAASLGPEWDIEIFEAHHKHKVDAPSGTALAIGKAAAQGRGIDHDSAAIKARDGITGERQEGTIGYSVARGGDVVGEHTAYFYGAGERIELSHIATNRALFAKGAIKAALWTKEQSPGLYSMKDVLGL